MGSETPVIVLSDHANLRYFMKSQALTARQARWASFLSEFNFDILHTPGKNNPADPASRRPDYTEDGLESSKVTLLGTRETEDVRLMAVSLLNRLPRGRVDHSSFMPPTDETLSLIQSLYHSDEMLQGRKPSFLTFNSQVWWWRDRVYVPTELRDYIMKSFHAPPGIRSLGGCKNP